MNPLNRKKGAGDENLFLIVIVAVLILTWINVLTAKKNGTMATSTSLFSFPTEISTSPSNTITSAPSTPSEISSNRSESYGFVRINAGNGPSEYQPISEYIVLESSSYMPKPVSMSGWYLTNGKGSRVYQVGSSVTHFESDKVVLPSVVNIFTTGGDQKTEPLVLPPNGRVYVVTGQNQYKGKAMPSFRENECTGYLTKENKEPLRLYPGVNSSCPAPMKEVQENVLDSACRQFVQYMQYCHTPNLIDSVKVGTVPQAGYIDGVGGLSQMCQDFVASHYSYNACLANHVGDSNFFTDSWHVYLNRPFELWATDHETMTLYDNRGKIVDQYSY